MYVYDTKDLSRVDSLHTQVPNPHYIDFSPDGLSYYITTLEATGHLAKFSTAGGFVDSVTTQPAVQPSAIAITADNQFGYVCNFSSPSARTEIHKYDLGTMQWIKSLQAGAVTHDIKITGDGSVVVACNRNTDDLTLIYPDADTLTFVAISSAGPSLPGQQIYGPFGVAIDHRDSLAFIACMDALQVRWLDIDARTIVDSIDIPVDTVGTIIAGPTLMAVSPDNDVVFVTTRQGNSVVVFRVSTKTILANIPLATPNPFGITMSDDGSRVYVACINTTFANGRVYVIDGNTYVKTDSLDVGRNSFGLIWQPAP
jgi:DNA-binding beta-propeller fold protein YncE